MKTSRNHKLLSPALFLAMALVFPGCSNEPFYGESRAVIDGWLDSDGYPVVVFTASMQPGEGEQSVADKMIRWGKVTVSDETDTVILTGKLDRSYFPPYRYYTFGIKGQPGHTYRVTAEYEDIYAWAECTMPYPTPIDSLTLRPIEGNDSLRAGTLHFTAPEDCPAYYYLCMREFGDGGRPLPTMMGTVKATRPGEKISVGVYNPKNQLDTVPFVPQLKIGRQVEVKLCRVTEEVYDFWSSYENSVMFGGSQFITSETSAPGNVAGGYGVWSVQGVSAYYLTVE